MSKKGKFCSIVSALFFVMAAVVPVSGHASVMKLSEANFDSTVSNGKTVIDFYADWCGPCKKFAPTFDKVSNEMQEKVTFAKVNIDQNRGIAQKYGITSIPTIILMKDGKEIGRNVGPMTYDSFRNFVSR